MCWNWALRSGCEVPSRRFRLACKRYPRSVKSEVTVVALTRCPWPCNARTNAAALLTGHRGTWVAAGHGLPQLIPIRA